MTVANKLEIFFRTYREQVYKKGDIILFTQDQPIPIHYLVSGQVGQYDISETGNKLMVNIYKPGAFFPMSNAVNATPNRFFFEALTDVQLRKAPADEVVAFLHNNEDVLFDLLQRLYLGMDGLLGRMTYLMSGDANDRLRLELSIACERFGTKQQDGSYLLHITELQLATQTGLARETVSRVLQKLEQDGHIILARKSITVHMPLRP